MTDEERAELELIAAGDQAGARLREKIDQEIAYIVIVLWLLWATRRKDDGK